MNVFLIILAIFNLVFAAVSVVPCIMGAAMGMDSPQAQNDPYAILLCYVFLSFPVVCLLCGLSLPILCYFQQYIGGLIVGFFPSFEAVSVILLLLLLDSGK